jgi:hypothetical protein
MVGSAIAASITTPAAKFNSAWINQIVQGFAHVVDFATADARSSKRRFVKDLAKLLMYVMGAS